MKFILLKQCIPGRTFDHFRANGYDIIEIVETDEPVDIPKSALTRFLDSLKHSKILEAAVRKK